MPALRGLAPEGLTARLVLAALALAACAVLATVAVTGQAAETRARRASARADRRIATIASTAELYASAAGTWSFSRRHLDALAVRYGTRIAVVGPDGQTVYDSGRIAVGTSVRRASQPRALRAPAAYWELDARALGPDGAEQVERCLGDEVHRSSGSLVQVPVDGGRSSLHRPDPNALGVVECAYRAAGIGSNDPKKLGVSLRLRRSPTPTVGSAVLLVSGPGVDVPPGVDETLTQGFWTTVAGVLVAAMVIAAAAGRWILRPVHQLQSAADRLRSGDRSQGVPSSGPTEVLALGSALDELATTLDREERARRTLTSDVSHEFRSPLANLEATLEAIQDRLVVADDVAIASLLEEVRLLTRLIDDLQQLAAADAGALNLQLERLDLTATVRATGEAFAERARQAGVELLVTGPREVVVVADRQRIRQVIGNLLDNAIRHAGTSGIVEVRVGRNPSPRVEIRDTGPGIPSSDLDQAFVRYWRADPSRQRRTGGSGLGLAIVKGLVEAHGGRVWAAAPEGGGGCFGFELPKQANRARQEEFGVQPLRTPRGATPRGDQPV